MNTNKNNISFKSLIIFAGTYSAFHIGSGYISGQEMMQYYAAFGVMGIVGITISLFFMIFIGNIVITTAHEKKIDSPYKMLEYLLGKKISHIYTYAMMVIFVVGMILMSSGAGATIHEYFGIPEIIGRTVILGAATMVVVLGLDRIVQFLSFLGPLNIVLLFTVLCVSIIMSPTGFADGAKAAANMDLLRGAPSWLLSGIKYGIASAFAGLPVFLMIGLKSKSNIEAKTASFTIFTPYYVLGIISIVAFCSNVSIIAGKEVPTIVMAQTYLSKISIIYVFSIALGGFSAIIVELWGLVRKLAIEGTARYRILTILIATACTLLSGILPFSKIVNLAFNFGLTFGSIFIIIVFIRKYILKII